MRSGVGRILTVGVILSLPAPAVLGQNQEAPSESSDAKPYLPPSPKKSVEIGDFYFKRKKYSAALSRYREATEDDPNYAPAYLGLGRVYEKIGLKQKALAAHAAGLTDVIIPERNRVDIDDIPEDVRRELTFHPVMTLGEVLDLALERTTLHAVS